MTRDETYTAAALYEFLAVVSDGQRGRVRVMLTDRRLGGRGLRALYSLHGAGRPFPASLPPEVVEVYLSDDEAEPLHDCERCGLPVPVHAGRRHGHEAAVDREYFPACPVCGGRTGRHAYWSRRLTN